MNPKFIGTEERSIKFYTIEIDEKRITTQHNRITLESGTYDIYPRAKEGEKVIKVY